MNELLVIPIPFPLTKPNTQVTGYTSAGHPFSVTIAVTFPVDELALAAAVGHGVSVGDVTCVGVTAIVGDAVCAGVTAGDGISVAVAVALETGDETAVA